MSSTFPSVRPVTNRFLMQHYGLPSVSRTHVILVVLAAAGDVILGSLSRRQVLIKMFLKVRRTALLDPPF
jgi:hypothetical protein